jgi:hypothetical protein
MIKTDEVSEQEVVARPPYRCAVGLMIKTDEVSEQLWGEASKVTPVDKLSLLLVAVFATMFLHERPTPQEWVGILLVGAGDRAGAQDCEEEGAVYS